MLSPVVVYTFLGCILFVVALILGILCDIWTDLCSIIAHTARTYDILSKWAIYYTLLEYKKGNSEPFDYIFPNDRKEMEEQTKQEECHIDNKKE